MNVSIESAFPEGGATSGNAGSQDAIAAYGLFGMPPDPRFDAVTRLATQISGAPYAAVAMVGADQVWVKSAIGLPQGSATPREAGFCPHTMASADGALMVADTRMDARFRTHPCVVGPPYFGAYAGVVMWPRQGAAMGVLCVMDVAPRVFTPAQLDQLHDLARCAAAMVELDRADADIGDSETYQRQMGTDQRVLLWSATPAGEMLPLRSRLENLFGRQPSWLSSDAWFQMVHSDDVAWVRGYWEESLRGGVKLDRSLRILHQDGSYHWYQLRGSPSRGPEGAIRRWFGTIEDVHERFEARARMAHDASHDPLTGLFNRGYFIEQLAALTADPAGAPFALLSCDLDNLKAVNNARGHAVGDRLLKQAAWRLQSCLRPGDVLARSGGDEFLILRPGVSERDGAGALAGAIMAAFAAPTDAADQPVALTASVGVALWPQDGDGGAVLLANAALALTRAKQDGRATFRFFGGEADEALRSEQALQLDLASALEREQLCVVFQPLLDLKAGRVCGFEALLRWHHPQRGTISPAAFVPLAEATGLIVPIGQWVLEQACRAAAAWPAHVSVAVNLSPVQFRASNDLLWAVAMALASSGLPPHRLELEVTESLPLLDDETNLSVLRRLRKLGVRIALDDFGTGYSSFGYLQRFSFDKLKIDRSIVATVAEGTKSRAILRAILGMAHTLGMHVTAEGVEQESQAICLRDEGCDQVQGFLYSRAVQMDQVEDTIARLAP